MSRRLFVALVALLAGCTRDPDPMVEDVALVAAPATVRWTPALDTSLAGSLSGVWGPSLEQLVIVGGNEAGAQIASRDGEAWLQTELPGVPLLIWAYGFAADDVYAVGVAGTMVHFDGARWSTLATGTRDDLWGVFGFAPDDLWIVGGDPFEGDPIVLHYDGHRFQSERILDHPEGAHALFKIWGVDGELHAVGQRGLVVRRREGVWETVSAGPLADQDFVSLWGTARDRIFAVGGRSEGRIARYDGERWTTTAPGTPGLNAVQILGDELLVGGVHGFLARHDPATGVTVVEAEGLVDLDVHALFATGPTSDGEGEAYAVGGSFAEPHRGVALRRVPPSL